MVATFVSLSVTKNLGSPPDGTMDNDAFCSPRRFFTALRSVQNDKGEWDAQENTWDRNNDSSVILSAAKNLGRQTDGTMENSALYPYRRFFTALRSVQNDTWGWNNATFVILSATKDLGGKPVDTMNNGALCPSRRFFASLRFAQNDNRGRVAQNDRGKWDVQNDKKERAALSGDVGMNYHFIKCS